MAMRTEREVQDMENKAYDLSLRPTRYRGMSYEEGVQAALKWVLDAKEGSPFDEDKE